MDFIASLRKEQKKLADGIAHTLFNEVKPYISNGKYGALQDYVREDLIPGLSDESNDEIDKESLEALIGSELKHDVGNVVRVYSDLLAHRIIREGDYSVPTTEEIDFDAIRDRGGIKNNKLLDRVIRYMNSQPELPLLGRIENGYFKPDHKVFETWKSFYDWENK